MSANVRPADAASSAKTCANPCADSPETAALARFLYLHVYRHGMLPALVAFTGLSGSQIQRQLTGRQHLSRDLSAVLLATMDRREAEALEEQHADAVRVRVRAELVSPGMRQLDLGLK